MLATVVDTDALLETVAYSFLAGVGVTLIFSIALWGATRLADLSRDERPIAAAAAAALALIGSVAFVATIVLGIVVMTQK